ncbi:MAG TPA: transposase family protein, partial [Candidatus Saccharimonadia bacterium]|nr:transposase family protein [Candidatus Saccharimonadia bacterium]
LRLCSNRKSRRELLSTSEASWAATKSVGVWLVLPFDAAFHAQMAAWRMDGKPRTARRFTVYTNCPLPTPEDRLLFILVYLKTYALQVVHGRLFGMVQGKANQWIHVLLPALLATLRALGDAPTRSLTALA